MQSLATDTAYKPVCTRSQFLPGVPSGPIPNPKKKMALEPFKMTPVRLAVHAFLHKKRRGSNVSVTQNGKDDKITAVNNLIWSRTMIRLYGVDHVASYSWCQVSVADGWDNEVRVRRISQK